MSDSDLKAEAFFDEVTKDVVLESPTQISEKPAEAPASLSNAKATPPLPTSIPQQGSSPAKLPDLVVRKSELVITSAEAAKPNAEVPEVAKVAPAGDNSNLDPYLNDSIDEQIIDTPDYVPPPKAHSTFKTVSTSTEIAEALAKNARSIGFIFIVTLISVGGFYAFKHKGGLMESTVSNKNQIEIESTWQMNFVRPWLPFGPEPKSLKEFQKSLDQAMIDLSTGQN